MMVVSKDMYGIYEILECFEIFIKLNHINERKVSEDFEN